MSKVDTDRYLDLLKRCLTGMLIEDSGVIFRSVGDHQTHFEEKEYLQERRIHGDDWPTRAETMVGWIRLNHLQTCVERVLGENIPGDLLEAGVWRGGASILMRAVLAQHNDKRKVYVADSFQGLPKPSKDFPIDANQGMWAVEMLSVPLSQVQANFRKYGLLDKQVVFLKGWFKDTLAFPPVSKLALLRVDCDLYESTTQVLNGLYDRVSPGGFVIIDDYNAAKSGRIAVDEFRKKHGIRDRIQTIDWSGSYWRKTALRKAANA